MSTFVMTTLLQGGFEFQAFASRAFDLLMSRAMFSHTACRTTSLLFVPLIGSRGA